MKMTIALIRGDKRRARRLIHQGIAVIRMARRSQYTQLQAAVTTPVGMLGMDAGAYCVREYRKRRFLRGILRASVQS